jgi:hypothetical protein
VTTIEEKVERLNKALEAFDTKNRKLIQDTEDFNQLTKNESDPYKQFPNKMIVNHSVLLQDLLNVIESLQIQIMSTKHLLDIISDTVMHLPDVETNPEFQMAINKAFGKHENLFGRYRGRAKHFFETI